MKSLDFYKGKTVLVTGHTGFKGAWLSIWLEILGAKVVGLALDPKENDGIYQKSGIASKIVDYRGDIKDRKLIRKVLAKENPDIVFHLAAQALVLPSYSDPIYTYEVNVMGTAHLLEEIRNTDSVKTIICITTDKVYENKEWIWPYREDEAIGGYDPYSSSKGMCELLINSYRSSFYNPASHSLHGKSLASVRAGNVIGGGDWCENRIVPDCIRAIRNEIEIQVRSPKAVRPWQHVLEPLSGYLKLGAMMAENPQKYCEAWNFGPESSNITTVKDLVEKIISVYGKGNWSDTSDPEDLHEAKLLSLDINKAKYKLNWNPVLSFEETIEFTVEWYKNNSKSDMYDFTKNQIKNYITKCNSRKAN
ncbi:UNVERIFIED_CONTAM: hypothetical protein GTU68_027199 [Idotea baltica]|nr:hypothetical protein [Idotea baltica]